MNKNIKKGIIILALTSGIAGSAFAYFSASAEGLGNGFFVATGQKDAEGGIIINEPSWGKTETDDMGVYEGGKYVLKDPSAQSLVNYDGFVIMKVTIPKASSILEGETQEKYNPIAVPAMDGNTPGTSDQFTLLKTIESRDKIEYYYGYNKVLKSKTETPALFNGIIINKFDKLVAGSSGTINFNVDIDARIVQETDHDTGISYTNAEDVFTRLYLNPDGSVSF